MRLPRRSKFYGFTVVEMMIVAAMIAIMTTAMSALIISVQRAYAASEAQGGIQGSAEQALNHIMENLVQSKRLFQNTVPDMTWVNATQLIAPAPSAMGGWGVNGTQLPSVVIGGSIAPTLSTFVSTAVGNSLFFISVDTPTDMIVNDHTGSTTSVRLDVYHFNNYYLALDNTLGIGGQQRIMLWEWHSVSFVDYDELAGLGDGVLTQNAAAFMFARGYRFAVDVATASVSSGIYNISGAGAVTSAGASPTIQEKSDASMIKIITGITGGGYHYGVSPNTTASLASPYPVPAFATASAKFPAGFETMIVGSNSARQVFIRLVLVAQGSFKGTKADQEVVMATVRDLY